MTKEKINLLEAFKDYAKKELEFIEKSEPGKIYHRVIPDFKDKSRGSIDFLYNKIKIGGFIEKDTIYLNKLKVMPGGKEEEIDQALEKINEVVSKGDMKLVNQID